MKLFTIFVLIDGFKGKEEEKVIRKELSLHYKIQGVSLYHEL